MVEGASGVGEGKRGHRNTLNNKDKNFKNEYRRPYV